LVAFLKCRGLNWLTPNWTVAQTVDKNASANGKKKVALDKNFVEQFKFLLRIVLPGVKSKEAGILGLHTLFLIARTFLSIFIARLDGWIVKVCH
jgi:hypothetical protein